VHICIGACHLRAQLQDPELQRNHPLVSCTNQSLYYSRLEKAEVLFDRQRLARAFDSIPYSHVSFDIVSHSITVCKMVQRKLNGTGRVNS
jgi:hypothetical protein